MHVPHLPLVFVLVMASPPTPSYLHSAYPRSTLALLRVGQVLAPTGLATVNEVLTKVGIVPLVTCCLSDDHGPRLSSRLTLSPMLCLALVHLNISLISLAGITPLRMPC